jgi:hypothetical protein
MSLAPEPLRSVLFSILDDQAYASEGEFDAHDYVRRIVGKSSDAQPGSESRMEFQDWVHSLTLDEARQVIDGLSLDDSEVEQINLALSKAGGALIVRDGELVESDEIGEALEVLHLAAEASTLLKGRFAPVVKQYQRSLDCLSQVPIEQEKAISEAVGALEAVVRIVANHGQDFGPNVTKMFSSERGWTKALSKTLGALQGYRSQVPGAGHGRYADSDLTDAEVRFVVRACGSAIAWVLEDDEIGRWA